MEHVNLYDEGSSCVYDLTYEESVDILSWGEEDLSSLRKLSRKRKLGYQYGAIRYKIKTYRSPRRVRLGL